MSGPVPHGATVSYRRQYRRCGKATCMRCAAGGPGHGPYWYAYWWEGGHTRSRYLGTQTPPGLDQQPDVAPLDGALPTPAPPQTLSAPGQATPPPRVATALRVRTLGGFMVWRGETALAPEQWRGQRATTLFKCLLSAPGHRLHREQASELLWPEGAPAAGATNLRTTLHLLRQILDGPGAPTAARSSYLRTEGTLIALAPGGAAAPPADWLDATAFAQAAQAALEGQDTDACRAALARYGGDYLPDDRYADWALAPRAALRRHYLALLLHLATLSGAHGALDEAEACLRRVLALEPGHEEAAATLMRLLAESGRRGEALRVYQALATMLEQELDVAPAAELAALRARLVAQEEAPLAAQLPARAAPPRLSNLPAALTSFVGRSWELAAVTELLATTRLLTLVGPGGCGKTRLALAVATRLAEMEAYPDGVWLVELAALADPTGVPRALATALGVVAQPNRPLLDLLAAFLESRDLLLVLDNCEHLIGACAELAAALLPICPRLRLLATSREALAVAGEQTYLVPSLSTPDPDHLPSPEQLAAYEAVRLFLERAHARRPELALTAANAPAVAHICARLDGLPLAIELAAARVDVLAVEGIAARLDDRFRLLTGGPRTALPRQQTLRATLDWSHELLSEPERVLLRRLAVFAGGWTLEAAEAVCADDALEAVGSRDDEPAAAPRRTPRLARSAVLDLLSGLAHKSLAQREADTARYPAEEARYRMLETVRQYSLEALEAAGEMTLARDRHLDWCIVLGEQAQPHLQGPRQAEWLDRLEREHDNLRAALRWSLEQPARAADGVRLAGAIWRLWTLRGYPHQGRHWLETLLARETAAPAGARACLLYGAAEMARLQGDYALSATYARRSLALYREVGDSAASAQTLVTIAWGEVDLARARALGEEGLALARQAGATPAIAGALQFLGNVAIGQGDLARAQVALEQSLALGSDLGDKLILADVLVDLSQVALFRGAYARADALATECLTLQRELGNAVGVATVLCTLGETAYCRGETARALAALQESLTLCRNLGHKDHLADALNTAGRIAWQQGDLPRARVLLEEALSIARDLSHADLDRLAIVLTSLGHVALGEGDHARAVALHRDRVALRRQPGAPVIALAAGLEGLAMALAAGGEAVLAVRLLGAAAAARDTLGIPLPPPDRAAYERALATTRAALGAEGFAAAWAVGQAATMEQTIAEALACAVPNAAYALS